MEAVVKPPIECSQSEIDVFEKLVSEGGEVMVAGLRHRIEQAEQLIFLIENECLAVGAIKNPNAHYKSNVFEKAGVSEKSNKYEYELGWLYVAKSARSKGYGRKLMGTVTEHLNGSSCFATTRENNESMHYLLNQYSFTRLGSAYKSDSGDYTLVLYVCQP